MTSALPMVVEKEIIQDVTDKVILIRLVQVKVETVVMV